MTNSRTDESVILVSLWAAGLPAGTKRLGGRSRPSDKSRVFAVEDEERVRNLAREVYGTDGTDSGDTVSLRMTEPVTLHGNRAKAAMLGRSLAHRSARDADVRLGHGVVIVAEGFDGSGGCVRNPQLCEAAELVLEVADVVATTAPQPVLRYSTMSRPWTPPTLVARC